MDDLLTSVALVIGVPATILLVVLIVGIIMRAELAEAKDTRLPLWPPTDTNGSWTISLPAHSREAFCPPPPHFPITYRITVTGWVSTGTHGFRDALYCTDHNGNFTRDHSSLRVNGRALQYCAWKPEESDRLQHRYSFLIDGPPERLTLAFDHFESGTLHVQVVPLPPDTSNLGEQRRREETRFKVDQEAARAAQKFADAIEKLSVRSQVFRNWEDPEFRDKFAYVHTDELIRDQADIREEATRFLAQHELVEYLRRHHPVIVERAMGRLESLFIAERFALDKRLSAEPPPAALPVVLPAPKRKLTAEQVRAIKIHRQQVEIGDRVALKLDKVETRLQIRERLGQMSFTDEEERDAVEQELIREIEEGDDHDNGKTL